MNKWESPCGYTDEEAKAEAVRCLSCKKPLCETGCPTSLRIRDFILELKNDNVEEAAKVISTCSSLSYICSIVCPHENQCIGHCILNRKGNPINVGKLERYVQDKTNYIKEQKEPIGKKVAVIGAGPAGLACAKELAHGGVSVDIYEALAHPGGVMLYGIPSYRLDMKNVDRIVKECIDLGVNFIYKTKLVESEIIALKEKYDYVFIGTGLTKVRKLGIPNDNISGVYDALDFLKQVNFAVKLNEGEVPTLRGTTIVVGAGNVAMDAARSAVRLGSDKVIIVYRRSLEEAPATRHEINDATVEGVEFHFLSNPVEVIGTSHVTAVKCEIMELTEPDESGRRRPVGSGRFETIACDQIISAIGQIPEDIYNVKELDTDHLYLKCDDIKTNIENIYAGGDIVLGAKTVVEAMVCGRKVAFDILSK